MPYCPGSQGAADDIDKLLALVGDYVAEALDREQGAAVTDPAVFRAHAAKYEVRWGEGR
jgi:cysteinyl-tRNA synthetase